MLGKRERTQWGGGGPPVCELLAGHRAGGPLPQSSSTLHTLPQVVSRPDCFSSNSRAFIFLSNDGVGSFSMSWYVFSSFNILSILASYSCLSSPQLPCLCQLGVPGHHHQLRAPSMSSFILVECSVVASWHG